MTKKGSQMTKWIKDNPIESAFITALLILLSLAAADVLGWL